ncbi:MAG: hypothetical protein AAB316_00330, partial [Bacteroidota bacterium]
KALWMSAGFLLFILGFSALVLSLVGVQLAFLTWLDAPGRLFGFLMKILMVVAGIVVVYLASTDWRAEE